MAWHLIGRLDNDDHYTPPAALGDQTVSFSLLVPGVADRISTNLVELYHRAGLQPTPVAEDLLATAIAAYTADVRIPRSKTHDGWTRDLVLHLPVSNPDLWNQARDRLRTFLSYLSGDRWDVLFRRRTVDAIIPATDPTTHYSSVCLFSGGLDSYAGAIDLLEETGEGAGKVALVGHYSEGFTHQAQMKAYAQIATHYPRRADAFQFRVQPPKRLTDVTEATQRSRSFLFLSLGIALSSATGGSPLYVPENGLISLNVPLTAARSGSCSTRTTHPHTLRLFRDLLTALELRTEVLAPYRFKTKGEILAGVANEVPMLRGARETLSCSHPAAARWWGGEVGRHCGYCIPCLVRRSAMRMIGLDRAEDYLVDVLANPPEAGSDRGSDLRAIQMAIETLNAHPKPLFLVMNAGSLAADRTEISRFVDVYVRGMREIQAFLGAVAPEGAVENEVG